MKKSKTSKLAKKLAPPANVLPAAIGVDPATIIFPVWSDQDLNNEKWEFSPSKKSVSRRSQDIEESFYKDSHEIELPCSIKNDLSSWKRVNEVFSGVDVSLYKESSVSSYTDLVDGSSHILHSEFMRDFISAVGILEYLGYTAPWPQETPSDTFIPTTDLPWRPWHHIYSCCKAGKGETHTPKINPYGKYIIRLYWMGCWRKITIDDRLPVDSIDRILLPTLTKYRYQYQHQGDSLDKEQSSHSYMCIGPTEIEIWPYLLAKALMKIASLTWNEEKEIVDFSIIPCLTGWIRQIIITKECSTSNENLIKEAYKLRSELMKEDEVSKKINKIDKKKTVKDCKLKKQKKQKE